MKKITCGLTLLFLLFSLPVHAKVAFDWATVGNPGNAPDTTGFGAVQGIYQISEYEVTNSQFTEFLNAVDPNGLNTLGLYNVGMTTDSGRGGIEFDMSAAPASHYQVKPNRDNWPVNYVTWWDAIRFVNWLHNGQGNSDTENGAYEIGLLTIEKEPINNGAGISRNAGATYFLPTTDQWYKAAFHRADGATGNYWDYHYRSDIPPTAELPPGGTNSANLSFAVGTLTDVGAYYNSAGPYGTYDQLGNVEEWTEALAEANGGRRLANGSWRGGIGSASGAFGVANPSLEQDEIGFRIARVIPEPSTHLMVLLTTSNLLVWRLRRD